MGRYYGTARSASDKSILFYYTKVILTTLMSEFWQQNTLAEYIFWLMAEKICLRVKVVPSKFVFGFFYILFAAVYFVFHDFKPLVRVSLVCTI